MSAKHHSNKWIWVVLAMAVVGIVAFLLLGRLKVEEGEAELDKNNRFQIENGDLLFVALPLDYHSDGMEEAIAKSTGDSLEVSYIHVAIAEVAGDSIWVIDATLKHGVERHPLDTFLSDFTLRDGSLPRIDILRLTDNSETDLFVTQAKQFCGRGYDLAFSPDNEEQYCSELVRNSYVTAKGDTLFPQQPMNWKSEDGTIPSYWTKLFAKLGMEVPQGVMGTNPNEMFRVAEDKGFKKYILLELF